MEVASNLQRHCPIARLQSQVCAVLHQQGAALFGAFIGSARQSRPAILVDRVHFCGRQPRVIPFAQHQPQTGELANKSRMVKRRAASAVRRSCQCDVGEEEVAALMASEPCSKVQGSMLVQDSHCAITVHARHGAHVHVWRVRKQQLKESSGSTQLGSCTMPGEQPSTAIQTHIRNARQRGSSKQLVVKDGRVKR
jgi:hypothetical protein